MSERSPSEDWADELQTQFSKNLADLVAAGKVTEPERACLQQVLSETPEGVSHLMIAGQGGPVAHLAGYFLVAQEDNKRLRTFLFSPVFGIEIFPHGPALRAALEQRLADPVERSALLHFVPIEVRSSLAAGAALKLKREPLEQRVFEHRQQSVIEVRSHNLELTQERLNGLPSVRDVLYALLKEALDNEFQGLDLSPYSTVVNRYDSPPIAGQTRPLMSSRSLLEEALYALANGVEAEQPVREYVSPSVPFIKEQAQSPTLDTRMQALISTALAALPQAVVDQTREYWTTQVEGLSLQEIARQTMTDHFFNELLQARSEGRISEQQFAELLLLFSPSRPALGEQAAKWLPVRLSLLEQEKAEIDLVGMFSVSMPASAQGMYLFGTPSGLEHFASGAALKADVLARLKDSRLFNQLLTYVSLEQQSILYEMYTVIVEAEVIAPDVFGDRVQSVINKQLRDIAFRMRTQPGAGHDVGAVVDHALDVRKLLDPRLLTLDTGGRWTTGLALQLAPVLSSGQPPAVEQLQVIENKLLSLQTQLAEVLKFCPDPRTFAVEVFQFAEVGKSHLNPRELVVHTYSSYSLRKSPLPLTKRPLVDTLLERLTACNPLPVGSYVRLRAQRNSSELKPIDSLEGDELLMTMDKAMQGFAQRFIQQLGVFFMMDNPTTSVLARLARIRGSALRYEVHIKQFNQRLSALDLQIINAVLDRPVRKQRLALDGFISDVCELVLEIPGVPGSFSLTNCFVLTQRGGNDLKNSGAALLWSVAGGFESFESLDACKQALSRRLLGTAHRWPLLQSIHAKERAKVLQALSQESPETPSWSCYVIESHWLESVQRAAIERQISEVEQVFKQAVASHYSAQSLVECVRGILRPAQAGLNLEGALEEIHSPLFNQTLPDWLKRASPEDQHDYAQILLLFKLASASGTGYSEDVPELLDFAREQLKVRLKGDFPEANLDPDQVEISVVQYLGLPGADIPAIPVVSRLTHPLTYFALTNFFSVQDGIRSYRSLTGQPLPEAMNDDYVRELIRSLDLATSYQALLTQKLTPGNDGVSQRQALFGLQLTPQILETALQAKLKGELSDAGWQSLKQVFNSPDAKAREPLNGVPRVIRPLAFRAIEGRHPDPALGMYLIGPASMDAGPQVLYVLYNKDYVLREFASQSDLLKRLQTDQKLQSLVLSRLKPEVRKIYENDGFIEPHIGYIDPTLFTAETANPPVALVADPLMGNFMSVLYKDTVRLRIQLARTYSHSAEEAAWNSLKYLLSLIVDTVLVALPAKLTWPLLIWQGEANLQAAVEASADDRWGEALFDFANSLFMLASARAGVKELLINKVQGLPQLDPPEMFAGSLTPEHRRGLQPYTANDVSLIDLLEDTQSGLFNDVQTGYHYIVLDGQVFRVVAWKNRWRIYLGENRDGPLLIRNAQQRWNLDLEEPLLGGSPTRFSLSSALAIPFFNRSLNISAFGMRNIRRLFPDKARTIRLAHEQAVHYLSECQEHLQSIQAVSDLSPGTSTFLKNFFSVDAIDDALLEKIRTLNQRLLEYIQHPDYAPFDSKRYAVCDLRSMGATALAGVYHPDKPVFLSEKFFVNQDSELSPVIRSADGRVFEHRKHFTATTLIHEFTHLALETIDIGYVYAYWPFEELFLQGDAHLQGVRNKLRNQRARQLNTSLQVETLFRTLEDDGVTYKKINPDIDKQLRKKTNLKTLEEVRLKFMNDSAFRADVILMNADSVTLLLSWLGYFKPRVTG